MCERLRLWLLYKAFLYPQHTEFLPAEELEVAKFKAANLGLLGTAETFCNLIILDAEGIKVKI